MRFYVERTARAVLTLWAAISLAFVIIRLIPGGPIDQITTTVMQRCPNCPPEQIERRVADRVERLGFDPEAGLGEQYADFILGAFQGDLGYSVVQGEAVTSIVGRALPWTLLVMVTATLLVFVIAITLGAVIAYKEGSTLDTIVSSVSIVMSAVPFYVLAFILLLLLAYENRIFPTGGTLEALLDLPNNWLAEPGQVIAFFSSALWHAALPIASVVLTQAGLQTLAMRGNSIQVLGEDYVRVARLRGLADRRIATRYVARNAILPLYTSFLMLIGYNLAASIILEEVFTYRGIGWYMFQGLTNRDYPLVMGTFIVYAVALVLAVYVADLTYSFVDPRVKRGGTSEAY